MGQGFYDPVRQGDHGDYELKETIGKRKSTLFIVNIVSLIIAITNFTVCMWIRFDLDFWEWVIEIEWYTYWNCTYVVMVAMLLHALNSLLSVYGTWFNYPSILMTSMILRFFIWFLTLTGAILICIYGVEESRILVSELDEVFMRLIYAWDDDERASRVLTMIQEYVGCCGASGNRDDYYNARKVVPDSCRHPVTGNCYGWGCGQTLAYWLEPWTCTLASLSLLFCVTDPFLILVTNKLRVLL